MDLLSSLLAVVTGVTVLDLAFAVIQAAVMVTGADIEGFLLRDMVTEDTTKVTLPRNIITGAPTMGITTAKDIIINPGTEGITTGKNMVIPPITKDTMVQDTVIQAMADGIPGKHISIYTPTGLICTIITGEICHSSLVPSGTLLRGSRL
jgi:hypothetical protein